MDESFDPSQSGDGVVCASALFHGNQIPLAEAALAEVKTFAGVPIETELHCKLVFSGQRRKHSAWRDVTIDTIFLML
jgi:hypothetical protein